MRRVVVVDDHGEHSDRQLYECLGTVRHIALECERIAWSEEIARFAVAITQSSLKQINELDAGMLEAGEYFTLVVQCDEERLEDATRPSLNREQMIGMAALGATA